MKTIDTKDILISEFYELRLAERDKWKNLASRIETYLEETEFDSQLNLALISMKAREEDLKSNDFYKCCDIAAPIFEQLENAPKWNHLELEILCSVICHNRDYKKSLSLTQEAFEVIDDLEQEGDSRIWKVKAMFSINVTIRLIRARYTDINPAEGGADLIAIRESFKYHLNLARAACTQEKHATIKLVLDIREALFNRNCDLICDGLRKLRKAKDPVWLHALEDEVMSYLYHFRMLLSTEQLNLLLGLRIRRRRQELGLSLDDFSEEMAMERPSLIKVENGTVGLHTPKLFLAAAILGVGVTYFYGDPETKIYETEDERFAHKMALLMKNSTEDEKEIVFSLSKTFIEHSNRSKKINGVA